MSQAENDRKFMQLALDCCRSGIDHGQSPFGSAIVREGKLLSVSHNHVRLECDATAHAEVHAIRRACGAARDIHLVGSTIYATTEPCPMCFTAIHWARIDRIVYGASIEDAARFGFNELPVSNENLKEIGKTDVKIVPHFMRDEAIALFEYWQKAGGQAY